MMQKVLIFHWREELKFILYLGFIIFLTHYIFL